MDSGQNLLGAVAASGEGEGVEEEGEVGKVGGGLDVVGPGVVGLGEDKTGRLVGRADARMKNWLELLSEGFDVSAHAACCVDGQA